MLLAGFFLVRLEFPLLPPPRLSVSKSSNQGL
jgi:hypothetical protein